jgi:ABC-2 type transport system ATP-binding protein
MSAPLQDGGLAIEARALTRRFGAFTAVNAIDIAVKRGEIFGFLGANGAGKTTAIRMFCGLLSPTSGSGQVAGCDIVREGGRIRSRIGYMAQKFALYPDLAVRQNIELYGRLYGLKGQNLRTRIEAMATEVELQDLLSRLTGDLPWGWQQRVSLACALIHEPEILFLDEPTGSVDPLSRRHFWDKLGQLAARGTTILVTSHYMDEVEYCDRLSIMVAGQIADQGSPSELKTRHGVASLQGVFLKLAEAPVHPGRVA